MNIKADLTKLQKHKNKKYITKVLKIALHISVFPVLTLILYANKTIPFTESKLFRTLKSFAIKYSE